jgi:hypothetical protein
MTYACDIVVPRTGVLRGVDGEANVEAGDIITIDIPTGGIYLNGRTTGVRANMVRR